MSKKHFIALAQHIMQHNNFCAEGEQFTQSQLEALARFCKSQNPSFMANRWRDYIAGECGPNGGAVKREAVTA